MDVRFGDPTANLAEARRLIEQAAAHQAKLVVLPELWSTGYDLTRAQRHAASADTGIFAETAELAREHEVEIVGSCLMDLGSGRVGNTAVYVDAKGQRLGIYSKTHLFRLMQEDQFLAAGDSSVVVDTSWGRVGLAICYDLRFPELWRKYALQDAIAVIIPAEWPHPRCAHWRTLLRARAIENQSFVIACNRVGQDPNNQFCGQSCVIDPSGEVLVEGDDQPGLLLADLDLSLVERTRARIPVFADRRPEIYPDHVTPSPDRP
jgi:predicted amidohydrolase